MKRRRRFRVRRALGLLACVGLPALAPPAAADDPAVTVTVTSQSGEALSGVRVSARAETDGQVERDDPQVLASGETNADGQTALAGLRPGTYTLVATAPDRRWSEFADACVPGWKPAATSLTLPPANVLRGLVQDPKGQPAPFAKVLATVGHWSSATYADKEGAFAFSNAPPGEAALYAVVEEKEGQPVVTVRSTMPSDTRSAQLVLPSVPIAPVPLLLVRVFTPGGRPVYRANGAFSRTQTTLGAGNALTQSTSVQVWVGAGAASAKTFDVAQHLEVIAARSEFGERLPCGPGRSGPFGPGALDAEMRLPPESFVEGRVLGPGDEPLAGVRVLALPRGVPPGKTTYFGLWTDTPHGEGVSGAGGRFRIGGLEKRKYELCPLPTAEHVGGTQTVRAESADVEVVVWRAVSPLITVLDGAGNPMAGATIKVDRKVGAAGLAAPGHGAEAETGVQGQVRLHGLDPRSSYGLSVFPPAGRGELLTLRFPEWKPADTSVRLEAARRIAGVVRDQDGQPVPGARLAWTREVTSGEPEASEHTGVADAKGAFVLQDLQPGTYRIHVRAPKGIRWDPEAQPKNGQAVVAGTEDAALKIQMPATLTLRLRAWTAKLGKPQILLAAPRGKEGVGPSSITKKVDREGRVVFDGLRWDVKYVIWMGQLKDGQYVYEGGLEPQARDLELRLMRGNTIAGRIEAPKGAASRKVWAVFPGFEVEGKTKSGGRFEIEGVPPGPWRLRATGKLGKEILVGEATCEPGQEAVVTIAPRSP